MTTSKELLRTWRNPHAEWRSAPFWSWNAKLEPKRLVRAVESMHSAGMGGFFMHSRYGLKTPYLGREWFECVRACVDAAKRLGMKACLYDEDRYPSGPAGGLVTRPHPELGWRRLYAGHPDRVTPGSEHLATFSVRGETLSFDVEFVPADGWNNNGAYIDTMNPEAVAEFIRVTHEAYAKRFGKDFGRAIPAIFTDEPQYGNAAIVSEGPPRRYAIQWTPALPREFRRRRGYDLIGHLPELILPVSGTFSKVRYDYRRTLTELFVEAFAAQIGRWCRRHHIAFTGHWLGEELLERQCRTGGAMMPHYEHEDWPGVDVLTDSAAELITVKQCSSVAAQLGRRRTLSEIYGCTGWDWPLEGHKFNGDWEFACGVNFRCPHVTQYSLAGGGKRDYPASLFSHSPWWKYYRPVEDYFARLGWMLTRGRPLRDVLVVHPIESAWGLLLPRKLPGGRTAKRVPGPVDTMLNDPLERIIHALTESHIDWDFGDESLMARHACIAGDTFAVGRMSYKLVLVPPSVTLRASTVRLLERFIRAGGKVLFAGPVPDRVDAEPSKRIARLARRRCSCGDVAAAVEKLTGRRLSVAGPRGELPAVWTMLRGAGSSRLLFLQSHDRRRAQNIRVRVEGHGPVVLWDCLTGTRTRLDARESLGRTEFRLDLVPTGSALVSLGLKVDADEPRPAPRVVARQTFAGPFDVEFTEPNTLPLDVCEYRIEGGAFSKPVPSLLADEEIRKRFGFGKRDSHEHQPWYLYATGRLAKKGTRYLLPVGPEGAAHKRYRVPFFARCEIRRTFHVTDLPRTCLLALEMPERFRITVNSRRASKADLSRRSLQAKPDGFWVDEDFRTIDIVRLLRRGTNDVTIRFRWQPDMELEDMYLVGDFGVERGRYAKPSSGKDTHVRRGGRMSLVKPRTKLSLGAWVGQGLDFYGAAVTYRIRVDRPASGRTILRLPGVLCTAAAIHVNGKTFVLPWAPFEADITDALGDGTNDVDVEIIGGRKNILGPLHVPWDAWTGPKEFDPRDPRWTKDYLLVGHGLTSAIVIETREGRPANRLVAKTPESWCVSGLFPTKRTPA